MLPDQIVFILNFFDACGFNSGSSRFSESRRVSYFIFSVHILMATLLTIYEFRLEDEYYASLGLSEAISESLQYSTALYTYWLIILDSIVNRRAHQQYWIILQRIDTCYSCQPKCGIRLYIFIFVIYFLKTMSILVIRLTISSFVGFTVDFAYMVLFIVCEIRMFYYLFCLEILQLQLKMVEDEVKTMVFILNTAGSFRERQSLRMDIISTCYSFELQRMKWIRQYFHCAYNMMDLLNQIFGWSHVAGISFCFYYLLTESNWLYIHYGELSHIHRFGKHIRLLYCCRILSLMNRVYESFTIVVPLTIAHWLLLIFYLFHNAASCSLKVSILR